MNHHPRLKSSVLLAVGCLLLSVVNCLADGPPRYIFLFIGDGMGEPQVLSSDRFVRELQTTNGVSPEETQGLAMLTLPEQGSLATFSKDNLVTDSAAAATALSSGNKVPNGAINRDDGLDVNYEPMGQFAHRHGFKVGIVSSVGLNHATPAAFYAVASSRNQYPEIARQMANSPLDYVAGESLMGMHDGAAQVREAAQANGFRIVTERAGFDALQADAGKVWVETPMPFRIDGEPEISLADHTAKAVELLKSAPAFLLMVEGGKIDWACHSNDAPSALLEVIEMDAAVLVALEFLYEHPDETLIIVTADHETGGLSYDPESAAAGGVVKPLRGQMRSLSAMDQLFSSIEAEALTFEEALPLMQAAFGVQQLTDEERAKISAAFHAGGDESGDFSYGGDKRLGHAWAQVVASRAGMEFSTMGHTSDRVPLYAIGAEASRFAGLGDNALLGRSLRQMIQHAAASLLDEPEQVTP